MPTENRESFDIVIENLAQSHLMEIQESERVYDKRALQQETKIKLLENEFFRQAFCAALNGLINKCNGVPSDDKSFYFLNQTAIKYAQEAVRQVVALNKGNADE